MKSSDIQDEHVVDLARAWQQDHSSSGVVARLMAEGVAEKLAVHKVITLSDRGLLDYGVSPYYAWPVPQTKDAIIFDPVRDGSDMPT